MTTAGADRALSEACIRLAWYVQKFGAVPTPDQVKLAATVVGSAFGHGLSPEEQELLELARDLRKYFLSMDRMAGHGRDDGG